jgi:DnaK suppressor protein
MEPDRLEYFRERLRQKQLALIQMVHRTEGYGREKDLDIQDVADMAVESYTKEFLFGLSSGDRHILKQISEALGRIDANTYGFCTNCDSPIQPKRLEAVPWARHCLACQALQEKGLLED